MKRLFGFYNGCYWMLLSTMEQAIEVLPQLYIEKNLDYIVKSLMAGDVIAVNEAMGFHAGELNDYTQQIEQDHVIYPDLMARVEVMKSELLTDVNQLEEKLGQPLTKEIILA